MTYFSIDLRNNYILIVQYNNNKYLNKFYYVNKLLYTLILKKNVILYFALFWIIFHRILVRYYFLVTWDDYFRWSEVNSEVILEKYKFPYLLKTFHQYLYIYYFRFLFNLLFSTFKRFFSVLGWKMIIEFLWYLLNAWNTFHLSEYWYR